MDASQVTALRDLPENQPRRVLLLCGMRTAIALCHCRFPLPALADYGSFLCFNDRIYTTQRAVSGITTACDVCHFGEETATTEARNGIGATRVAPVTLCERPFLPRVDRHYSAHIGCFDLPKLGHRPRSA